ncbi:MAG: CD225/dispanin family protein [Bacteroidaceae bacterium]|nr:CD225/dispanin family protein [Bacteroidaceae bacterium]
MENNQKPDNYLVWAILSTVMCCLPCGIVAVVYSNKVDSLWFAGNHQEALDAAKNARMWTFITVGVGVVLYVILGIIGCAAAMFG